MKADLSLRVNIFVIAVVVIILGQSIYSYFNLRSFQASYIHALQEKSARVGSFLKDDINSILKLGIPLQNMAGLEQALSRTLRDIPEAGFIEIVDPGYYMLYRADHEEGKKVPPETIKASFVEKPYILELSRMGLSPHHTDVSIALEPGEEVLGYINIHISGRSIQDKSRQILWDMLTVMLTSLLLTFEFLTFFVVYCLKHPLEVLRCDIALGFSNYRSVKPSKYLALGEIGVLAGYYNAILHYHHGAFAVPAQKWLFTDSKKKLQRLFVDQDARIHALTQKIDAQQSVRVSNFQSERVAGKLRNCLYELKTQLDRLSRKFGPPSPSVGEGGEASPVIPYSLIRPLIFLFIMADGFSLSFFPMFVDSMYEPFWGLSREVMMSLPMSAFMLVLAFSMPLTGNLTDSKGWYMPLILGLVLNAVGHLLTAMAQDITQLIVFRSLAAVGFGMVFMCCQRFVIDNTNARSRAMGMSGFLAAFFSGDICGTVIGAMMAERIGFAPVFYVSALFTGLALVFLLIVFQGPFRPSREKFLGNRGIPLNANQLVKVFRDREFSTIVWLQAVPAKLALVGFLFFFVPLYLNSIGALQSNIGRIIMCYSICIIFIGPLVSYLIPQEHLRKYLVAAGGFITAGGMLSFAFTSGLVPLMIVVILLGIAQSISVPSQASIISETDVVQRMGSGAGMGVYRFWERAGNVTGPLLMAFLIARFGYANSVVALGGVTLVCSLLYLGLIASKTKKPDEFE